jgi:syntaxin 1B/2/3
MEAKKFNIMRTAEINLSRKLTEEEANNVIENPQLIQDMMKNKLLSGAHDNVKNAVFDIEERHKDLQKLEKNIKEIHRMFLDLSLLVNMQGEMIDNIEVNVKSAKCAVFQAEDDLLLSKNNLSSARKVYIYIYFFLNFFYRKNTVF